MPRRTPDAELSTPLCEPVSKNYHPLLRQPERRLEASSSIVESDKTSWKNSVWFDYLQRGLGNVVRPEQSRTEGTDLIATDKLFDVPHVVRDEDGGNRRWSLV